MRFVSILLVTVLCFLPTAVWARCVQGDCLNGQGTVVMPDGRKYVGQFKEGVRVGQGLMTFPDGTKYIGNWQYDKPHGRGKLSAAGKYEYVGEFDNGVRDGQGILETADGKKYEGQWENDVPHGQGKIIYPDGAQYTGQFKNGKRHGEGEALYPDGSIYAGQWLDDTPNGRGTMTYANGEQFTGEFMDGQRHGMGSQMMADGSTFVGQWQKDVLSSKEEVVPPGEAETAGQPAPEVVEIAVQEPPGVEQPVVIEVVEQEAAEVEQPAPEVVKIAAQEPPRVEQPVIIEVVEQEAAEAEQPEAKDAALEISTVSTGETVTAVQGNFATVLKNGVYVRSGPSSEYRIIRSVNRGYPVEIIERQDDWARIRDYLESEGWVYGSLLGANNSVIVMATKANLRSGPGTDNPIVDQIDYGTVLRVRDISNEWYRVEARDTMAGWLHGQLIWPAAHEIAEAVEAPALTLESQQEEVDEQYDLQVEEIILAQLKEQELARQYEAELTSSQKAEEQEKVIEHPGQTEEAAENMLVVEAKPIAEPEGESLSKDDPIAAIIEASTTPAGDNYASITSTGKGANIRSAPSLDSEVLRAVSTGYPLLILEQQYNWTLVQDFRDRKGWVYSRLLNENSTVVVKVGKANLRSGPSLRDDIVAKVDYSTIMQVDEVQEDWVRVSSQVGLAGWLHKEVIWP